MDVFNFEVNFEEQDAVPTKNDSQAPNPEATDGVGNLDKDKDEDEVGNLNDEEDSANDENKNPEDNLSFDELFAVVNDLAGSVSKDSQSSFRNMQNNSKGPFMVQPNVTKSSSSSPGPKKYKWAKMCNLNAKNYAKEVIEPARSFPFELDTFQKKAVMRLERKDHVFVAAHTSAGKTVVAEYAISLALRNNTRIIYTSPIKALSNQKYRDFRQKFSQVDDKDFETEETTEVDERDQYERVGLMTGDTSLHPDATCLVVTTEILRSMLYRGADIVKDIEWVVFDEVQFVNDVDRGVVWEEVIIMLPKHVNMIFLSATTPNTMEFCAWIGNTKQRNVYVVQTHKRPVPLQHYIYSGKKKHKILNEQGKFLSAGFEEARRGYMTSKEKRLLDHKKNKTEGKIKYKDTFKQRYGAKKGNQRYTENPKKANQYFSSLIKDLLLKEDLVPCVCFTFSKKKCDMRASGLEHLDLTTAKEKSRTHVIFQKALKRLNEADRTLPQLLRVRDLLKRGIAVHHSGLLPLLKEVVEILFAKGLVKVLFATETFAVGVNMPAKSVIFNGVRKHDGSQFRYLLPGEYIQMSGRAGRRGLDSVGTVLIAYSSIDMLPSINDFRTMMTGKATKLESQFKLSYNLILKIFKLNDLSVSEMMKKSFSEYENQRKLLHNDLIGKLAKADKYLRILKVKLDKDLSALPEDISPEKIGEMVQRLEQLKSAMRPLLEDRNSFLKREIKQGTLITFTKPVNTQLPFAPFLMAGYCTESLTNRSINVISSDGDEVSVPISDIVSISVLKIKSASDISHDTIDILGKIVKLKMKKLGFVLGQKWKHYKSLVVSWIENYSWLAKIVFESPDFLDYTERRTALQSIENKLAPSKEMASDSGMSLFPDFQARLYVLKQLKYIDEMETLTLKGKISIELGTCDELLVTELILENIFASLDHCEIAAMLSAFIVQGKSRIEPKLNINLQTAKQAVEQKLQHLYEIQLSSKVDVAQNWIEKSANFCLMQVVYEWARGVPFKDLCDLTDIDEGVIVRSITRLDETLREVKNVASLIGDEKLAQKYQVWKSIKSEDTLLDSSKRRNMPLDIQIGNGRLIDAIEENIIKMSLGQIVELHIPPKIAEDMAGFTPL